MGTKRTVTITHECGAPPEALGPEEEITPEIWALIPNGMNCDGGGVPGSWCVGCPWEIQPDVEEDSDVY